MVTRFWHRYRMIGLERLPPSPVLFVCNHSGCGACEVIGMIGAWWRHFGLTRSPRALMHDTFYLIPGIAHLERAVGALRANRENGLAVLEAGRDLDWFFNAYLRRAALPELVETRQGDQLTLEWRAGGPFAMPIEVKVGDRIERLTMDGGRGVLTIPAGAHVVIDPMARVLRRSVAVEQLQAWQARQTAAARP